MATNREFYILPNYPSKIKIKEIPSQIKNEFIPSKHALREMLKEVLKPKGNDSTQ